MDDRALAGNPIEPRATTRVEVDVDPRDKARIMAIADVVAKSDDAFRTMLDAIVAAKSDRAHVPGTVFRSLTTAPWAGADVRIDREDRRERDLDLS